MQEGKVAALKYEVVEVGRHLKSSKKRYLWSASIGQRVYNLVLDDSLVSGKSKLSINGKVFHQVDQSALARAAYEHSFIIDGCLFNILQNQQLYELRINNKLFSHMLMQGVTAAEFRDHTVDEDDFQLAGKLRQTDSKKITLSLPGMGSAMKKKKGPVQSDNWSQFAGQGAFPSFFGETEQKEVKPAKVEEEKSEPEPVKVPTAEEFSTLQNLFQTITACGEYLPKASEEPTPTYDLSEIPAIPQINLEEFNTMQNLFATINPTCQPVPEKQLEAPSVKPQDFNTMQNLFATLQQLPQPKKQTKLEAPKPSFEEFSTMQNLFATMKQSPPQPQPVSVPPQDFAKININDFSTLQNLFATGFPVATPPAPPAQKQQPEEEFHTIQHFATNAQAKPQPAPSIDVSKIDLSDFTTIQNLFSTNALVPPKGVLGSTDKANKVEEPQKPQVPNPADFNTMQNLFATNAAKSENDFWKF